MNKKPIMLCTLVLFTLLFTACSRPVELTATPLSMAPSATTVPEGQSTPTPDTPQITMTLPPPTPSPTITEPTGFDAAAFIADVSIPDGSNFKPGESFIKTWRLQNTGNTTWTTEYALVFEDGSDMGGPLETPLEREVAPGDEIDISVELTAPETPGELIGFWMLRNANGVNFGTGEAANESFWVAIVVLTTEGNLPDFTGPKITFADMIVNQDNYKGPCPVTLTFTGDMIFDGEGDVTYHFESGAQDSELMFVETDPETVNFEYLDTHTVFLFFTVELSRSVDGWARVLVTAPNNFSSTPINFTVTCNP